MSTGLCGHVSHGWTTKFGPCMYPTLKGIGWDSFGCFIIWVGLDMNVSPFARWRCISYCCDPIRFAAKAWYLLVSFSMYRNTHVLSVQKDDWSTSKLNSCRVIRSSLVATMAADSFILGIVTGLRGASLDFPITKEQITKELGHVLITVCIILKCLSSINVRK